MKYLYSFNENVSSNKIEDIKDCFIYFYDVIGDSENSGIRIKEKPVRYDKENPSTSKGKFRQYRALDSKQVYTTDFDYEIMVIPELGEYIKNYRKSKIDETFIDEMENSISLASGFLNMKLEAIVVEYVREDQEGNYLSLDYDNGDHGRGVVNRGFVEGGDKPDYAVMYENRNFFDIKEVYNFMKSKNDRIRYAKIYFSHKEL